MGLDKDRLTCLNSFVNGNLPLHMGWTGKVFFSLKGYILSLFGRERQVRLSPSTQERERFEEEVKDQFIKLKEKGLSIPIFTL